MTDSTRPAHRFLHTCIVCGSEDSEIVHEVGEVPIYPFRRAQAASGTGMGTIAIARCRGCGHLYNAAFDPAAAEELYGAFVLTNTPVSESMVRSVEGTASWILARARSRTAILEVGGGAGALSMALARSGADVHLVEPSRALSPDRFSGTGVTFYQSMFPTDALGDRFFDIVICRQVLEHVPVPEPFLGALRTRMKDDAVAYVEIPSAEYILENRSIVDFHYPHVHYYLAQGAEALFNRAGFDIVETVDIKDGHDIGFMLRLETPARRDPQPRQDDDIAEAFQRLRRTAADRLARLPGPVALYGANAYSQALLGLFPDGGRYAAMFDDTESYVGYSAYGSGVDLPIGPPDADKLKAVGTVVITAYLHDRPIARKVREMGFDGPILTVRCDRNAGQGEYPDSLFL